jgi:hypothetical protein
MFFDWKVKPKPLPERIMEEERWYPLPTWSCCVYYNHDGDSIEGLYHGKNSASACLYSQITSYALTNEAVKGIVNAIRRVQEKYGIKKFGHVATYQGFNNDNCIISCLVCGANLLEGFAYRIMSPGSSKEAAMGVFLCKEHFHDQSDENMTKIRMNVTKIVHDADYYWPPVQGREVV